MKKFERSSLQGRFSHIYCEEKALKYPAAKRALSCFPKSRLIIVKDYKRVFNRPRQSFRDQKKSVKLILAVKKPPFIYTGSDQCQKHGNDRIHYVTPMINCLYDCDYCYLQGMYDSANIVLFVNNGEIIKAVKGAAKKREDKTKPLYVSISYDTDLMSFEKWTGYCGEWIDFATKEPGVSIELRTKSAAWADLRKHAPGKNVILAWTISPEAVANKYEKAAPSVEARLEAARRAVSDGWTVRLCIDPVIPVENWPKLYSDLIAYAFSKIPARSIEGVAIGPFRMKGEHLKRLRKMRTDCDICHMDLQDRTDELMSALSECLLEYLPENKIVRFEKEGSNATTGAPDAKGRPLLKKAALQPQSPLIQSE